jgi:hypothetical protein
MGVRKPRKNFLFLMIFSLPLMIIFVDRKIFKQKDVQYPIIFPPNKIIFLGRKSAGKKNIEITTIPVKKNIENKEFLIILIKN